MSEAWVDHAPTAEQVFKDTQGDDPIDVAARKMATFEILRSSIQVWEAERFYKHQMSMRATAKFDDYGRALTGYPFGLKFNDGACTGESCIRWQYFQKESYYSTDTGFIGETLGRYFPPEYVKAQLNWERKAQHPVPRKTVSTDSSPETSSWSLAWLLWLLPISFFWWALTRKTPPPAVPVPPSPPPVTSNYGRAEWAPFHRQPNGPNDLQGVFFGKSYPLGIAPITPGAPICSTPETHTLIVAPTRAGKGTRVIIPTLLGYNDSMVVIDPKGENAAVTARSRHNPKDGLTAYIVNPWGVLEAHYKALGFTAATFNPLDAIDRNDPNAVAIAQSLAATMCPVTDGKDKYWQGSAANVLAGVLLWITERPDQQKTLARAREIVTLSRAEFTKFLVKMASATGYGGAIKEMVSQYIDLAPETYSGIMSNLAESTKFLSDPRIKASTAASSFSMKTLRDQRTTVYLVIPHDRIQTHATWLKLVISAAMAALKTRDISTKPRYRCMFLIDEFGSMGNIPDVPRDIALMSGYGVDFAFVVQGLDQLEAHYGRAGKSTILNNCAYKWFCNISDLETAC